MGLGTVNKNNTTYLVIAGGFIWNKSAGKDNPHYATQEWVNAKGETQERVGAKYSYISGIVKNVFFKTHENYGEALYVVIEDDGESFTLNIKTNTANSQHMMKALLLADLTKPIFITPYDFVGSDNRRAQGVSFKQDGEKIDLKRFDIIKEFGSEWKTEKSFWSSTNKKKYTRWLEDLSDRFVAEVEEKIIPSLGEAGNKGEVNVKNSEPKEVVVKKQEPTFKEKPNSPKVTPLKMKKFLKEYVSENYEDKELPTLSKEELKVWYSLAINMEELPFEKVTQDQEFDEGVKDSEVDEDDIQAQLDALAF